MPSFLLLLWAIASAWAGTIRVDVLDVGQGDSILIRTPANKTILIDASEARADVLGQLRREGVDHLDLVIATHPHADHIGGMEAVVRAIPPKLYTDNGLPHTTQTYANLMKAIEEENIPYRAAEKGQVYNLDDGARLEILNPAGVVLKDTRSDLNANSVVTRLVHGEDCVLLVGDSEEPTEDLLLDGGIGQCDVLKVAHHGSRHSSTSRFLGAVQPKYALISVGMPNRYRHPGQETLDRLRAIGAKVFRTDLEGKLTVLSSGRGVKIETEHGTEEDRLWVGGESTSGRPAVASSLDRDSVLQDLHARSSIPDATPMDGPDSPDAPDVAPAPTTPTPPATPAATPAEVQPVPGCAYIASKNSEVFHDAKCGNGLKISAQNLVCYATKEAAIAAGRRPAGCCHP